RPGPAVTKASRGARGAALGERRSGVPAAGRDTRAARGPAGDRGGARPAAGRGARLHRRARSDDPPARGTDAAGAHVRPLVLHRLVSGTRGRALVPLGPHPQRPPHERTGTRTRSVSDRGVPAYGPSHRAVEVRRGSRLSVGRAHLCSRTVVVDGRGNPIALASRGAAAWHACPACRRTRSAAPS